MTVPNTDSLERLAVRLTSALRAFERYGRIASTAAAAEARRAVLADCDALGASLAEPEIHDERLTPVAELLAGASRLALGLAEPLRSDAAARSEERSAFRASRRLHECQEILYPLEGVLPAVDAYFAADGGPGGRVVSTLERYVAPAPGSGVLTVAGTQGDVWAYVPERVAADRALPLVFALHGGLGDGRSFLWRWVRAARSVGAIVVAPDSLGQTWNLHDEAPDAERLSRLCGEACERWNIDRRRILLTGMSDGGTFSLVAGLQADSPFTHLAPFGCGFHPMLVPFADPRRLAGLPVFLAHGALDAMFPVDMARASAQALSAAGARVRYLELEDLGHSFPAEVGVSVLEWLAEIAGP